MGNDQYRTINDYNEVNVNTNDYSISNYNMNKGGDFSYDYEWFNTKIQLMRPVNTLKEKATIEWFRKRKS